MIANGIANMMHFTRKCKLGLALYLYDTVALVRAFPESAQPTCPKWNLSFPLTPVEEIRSLVERLPAKLYIAVINAPTSIVLTATPSDLSECIKTSD